ncbi:MAG TPA: Dyp-type peroxidase [Rickettsiales bacterium]|nr:Dyp-type peroxidase [Rickettsiales bacterium]
MNNSISLDLADIQGNIIKSYGRYGFPYARYILFSVHDGDAGRKFVRELTPLVTTAVAWKQKEGAEGLHKPDSTLNIAFTYHGLKSLGLCDESLHSFPSDFTEGMRTRREILGDDQKSAPEYWDPVWCHEEHRVAIWVAINAQSMEALEKAYAVLQQKLTLVGPGVIQLHGHRGENGADNLPYQEAAALFDDAGKVTPKEHFGYTDGISDPFFKGTGENPAYVLGAGKPNGRNPASPFGWDALEPGEFIMGLRDEAKEQSATPSPYLLGKNGTFMVYRKLHENVGSFNSYLEQEAARHPENDKELIAAKFAGRWRNGAPLALFPQEKEADAFMKELQDTRHALHNARGMLQEAELEIKYLTLLSKLVGFDYKDDLQGSRCPLGAHIRRANPRGSLEFGQKDAFNTPGALSNRRRILRRGLPYGNASDKTDNGNHGIIFMALAASISRQFEFVQQQWINYSNDFKLANEKDPLTGNNACDKEGNGQGRMQFPAEPGSGKSPHFCKGIPRFIETRGGEYFFIPSLTALNMIGNGTVDPT